jgi:hypothetical protein
LIDNVDGVICSDLKGLFTPKGRQTYRYKINFADCKKICRVFVAKAKDAAAKRFEHLLAHFERRFDCRVFVLCTDGGREYNDVDLFCENRGVARQVTEANSSASNGKAERMHRTIMNMCSCSSSSGLFSTSRDPRFTSRRLLRTGERSNLYYSSSF